MNPCVIRPLAADDETAWRALWRGYLDFYETTVDEAVYATSFRRMLAGNGGAPHEYRALVAARNDRLIGLAHYLFHRHGWRIEDVCYLQDLFVAPDARGGGVGAALIAAVYAAADAQGAPLVYWTTQHFNAAARRLYDRIGVETPFIKYQRA